MTLQALAAEIAEKTGTKRQAADSFLRALIAAVTDTLAAGGVAKIKGLGAFSATADGDIVFQPDAMLADEVNAPFAFFEPVEIADGVVLEDEPAPEEQTEEPTEEPAKEDSHEEEDGIRAGFEPNEAAEAETPETEVAEPSAPELEPEEPVAVEAETPQPETPETPAERAEPSEPANPPTREIRLVHVHDEDEETPFIRYEQPSRFHWGWLITGLAIGLILGIAAGYFLQPRIDAWLAPEAVAAVEEQTDLAAVPATLPDSVLIEEHPDTAAAPAVEEPAQQPAPAVVNDTIRRNRFLTTMAREHYGQMEYWVYIYLANSDKLGNPDGARPGTVVRIPQLSEYGVTGRTPDEIERAKQKAVEIYAPYRR